MLATLLALTSLLVAPLDLDQTLEEIERARVLGDEEALKRHAALLRSALDEVDPESASSRLRYALAYVHWRLALIHERETDPYERQLKEAERVLKELLEDAPDHAEAQALYGSVNGGLITGMWSGMRRGPRADDAYERARELAPDNPRVAMHQGVSRLFRPGMFGGGVDRAEEELEEALELFEKEKRGRPWPNWGRAEVHGWLGVVMVRKQDFAAARRYYEAALAVEPELHWVRERLLPELEAAEARR